MADRKGPRQLTNAERKAYEKNLLNFKEEEQKKRQQQYAPKEEHITFIGDCGGTPHCVVKITTYSWRHDNSLMYSASIETHERYCCSNCKVAFDPSVDPAYEEPHPVRHHEY